MSRIAAISDKAITQEVGGETVILDLGSEQYFSLDQVGTQVWQLLKSGLSEAEVVETLLAEYEVDVATLSRDVSQLMTSLADAGLISLVEPSG